MKIIGESVWHKSMGKGSVIAVDDRYITVRFETKDMMFVFPGSFTEFLTFEQEAMQAAIIDIFKEKQRQELEKKQEKEAEINRKKNIQPIPADVTATGHRKIKIPPRKNLAFKLNYCDGGSAADSIGYRGVCSDSTIQYNIQVANRSWCSYEECRCRMYLDDKISRTELDSSHEKEFNCYESTALSDWVAHAGTDLRGDNDGKARRLPNAQMGSLAILTTRYPGTVEAERRIVGVFIVDDAFEGSDTIDGSVSCHSKYHVEIRPKEVNNLRFWDYYQNTNPEVIRWGTGLYRFISDENALRLLQDIAAIKNGTADQTAAEDTLNYFIELHGLD